MGIGYYPALGTPASTKVTEYASNKILDHVCGGTQIATPDVYYMGLLWDDGGLASGGQPTNEFAHADYFRAEAVYDEVTEKVTATWQMNAQNNRKAINDPWGDAPFCAVFDALTAGNCWFWGHYHKVPGGTTAQVLRVDRAFYTLAITMQLAL
jgi:hypothetical protein